MKDDICSDTGNTFAHIFTSSGAGEVITAMRFLKGSSRRGTPFSEIRRPL